MRALLAAHVDAVVGRQRLLQAHAHGEPEDGGERAVRNGGRNLDKHLDEGVGVGRCTTTEGRGRGQANVGEVDDGELTKGNGVLRVGNG